MTRPAIRCAADRGFSGPIDQHDIAVGYDALRRAAAFLVTATQIGLVLGLVSSVTAAAPVCAGLLSVLVFPPAALALLGCGQPAPGGRPDRQERNASSR